MAVAQERTRVPAVRVGALRTVAGGLLAQAIVRLYQSRPHARAEVRTASNPELLAALKSGDVDFAVGRMAEPATMQGCRSSCSTPSRWSS